MLKSLCNLQGELQSIFKGSIHESKLADINWVLMATLINFLKPYQTPSYVVLEGRSAPPSNFCALPSKSSAPPLNSSAPPLILSDMSPTACNRLPPQSQTQSRLSRCFLKRKLTLGASPFNTSFTTSRWRRSSVTSFSSSRLPPVSQVATVRSIAGFVCQRHCLRDRVSVKRFPYSLFIKCKAASKRVAGLRFDINMLIVCMLIIPL